MYISKGPKILQPKSEKRINKYINGQEINRDLKRVNHTTKNQEHSTTKPNKSTEQNVKEQERGTLLLNSVCKITDLIINPRSRVKKKKNLISWSMESPFHAFFFFSTSKDENTYSWNKAQA